MSIPRLPLLALAALLGTGATAALLGTPATAQTRTGSLEPGDTTLRSGEYTDVYTVEARSGQTITVDLTSDDFDPYLIVRAPSGAQEDNDDFEGSTSHSRIDMEATESGTYTITVTSYQSGETGRYRVSYGVDGRTSGGETTRGSASGGGASAGASSRQLVGTWVGAEVTATQYSDAYTGQSASPNGIGTTLELRGDGTFRQSRVLNQSSYSCTTTLTVDERGTYTVRGNELVLNRQSGRSEGNTCGQRSSRTLEAERAAYRIELTNGGSRLVRMTPDGERFDELDRN